MSIVNRNQINLKKPLNGEPFFVQAWDGEVCIRKWSGTQRALLLARVSDVYGQNQLESMVEAGAENVQVNTQDFPKLFKLMAEIVAASICDENAVCLYDVNKPEDVAEVENFDADLLQTLFEECAKRNGLL